MSKPHIRILRVLNNKTGETEWGFHASRSSGFVGKTPGYREQQLAATFCRELNAKEKVARNSFFPVQLKDEATIDWPKL